MHIPDNYLSPVTCAVIAVAMAPVWAKSIKKVKEEVTKTKMPLLGIGAAFSFLMMMFNVPLPGGTTGHAVGGTLLAILIGPYAACISISVALLIQALFFGDGGILAYGANAFNLAFVLPFLGHFIYKFIKDRAKTEKGEYIGIVLGSYIGINMAALFTAIEFGIQPLLFVSATGQPLYSPYPLSVSIPAMMIPHLLVVGIVEVIFTVMIFAYIKKVSPGTIFEGAKEKTKAIYGLIIALICLSPLGLLATGTAWGEWGTVPGGLKSKFEFKSVMQDYMLRGLPKAVSYIISAVAGVAILLIIFKIISSFMKNKTRNIPS